MRVPTIKVKFPHESGDYMVINKAKYDADPDAYELYEGSAEVRQKSPGWFDVVVDGEVVNEKSLREDDAKALAAKMSG